MKIPCQLLRFPLFCQFPPFWQVKSYQQILLITFLVSTCFSRKKVTYTHTVLCPATSACRAVFFRRQTTVFYKKFTQAVHRLQMRACEFFLFQKGLNQKNKQQMMKTTRTFCLNHDFNKIFKMNRINSTQQRHCGLDPQSPTNNAYRREIAGQARNDGHRICPIGKVSGIKLESLNINIKQFLI